MKRLDLQAIRGLAILLVVLFHLQPQLFSLGFTGVDIFFVLSGYLMTLILVGSKQTLSRDTLSKFYSRRFKRIVPLYYIVLVIIHVATNFLLVRPDKEQLVEDMHWTLSFAANLHPFFEWKGYWDQMLDTRFLVHCWSLAVEIQFYLIAPFVILAIHSQPLLRRTCILLTVILASLIFQWSTAPSKTSYFLLPSRIWQFLLGSLAYQEENEEKDCEAQVFIAKETPENESPPEGRKQCCKNDLLVLLFIGLVLLNPQFPGKVQVARLLSCLLTAFLIYMNNNASSPLLSNEHLVFLGDISYTMYLVHWPLIVGYKYFYNLEELALPDTVTLFVIIFLATLFIHYVVEQPIIFCSLTTGLCISVFCIGFIVTTSGYYMDYLRSHDGVKLEGYEVDELIKWNLNTDNCQLIFPTCGSDTVTEAWTGYTEDPSDRLQCYSNGTLKVLVVGNSIAYRAFSTIQHLFNGRYKELRLFARSTSCPLANDPGTVGYFTDHVQTLVERMKPDVIWNIHGHRAFFYTRPFVVERKEDDETFQQFQKNLNFYSSRVKEMVIDMPYYWKAPLLDPGYQIAKRLYLNLHEFSDLKVPRSVAEEQQIHHRNRILSLNCSNCHLVDPQPRFFDDDPDNYWLYNRKNLHAYTTDGFHLNKEMMTKIEPLYSKVIEEIIGKYGA